MPNIQPANLTVCRGCCWTYSLPYGLLGQQVVVPEELHKREMDLRLHQAFLSAPLSIVKDRLSRRQRVVDMLVEEEHLDRTLVEAWDAFHIALHLDMNCSRRRGFGNSDRISLVVACLGAIDGMLGVGGLYLFFV